MPTPQRPSARLQSVDGQVLDEIDQMIVAALQVAPRASWQRIASALEVSESTVSRRAKRLLGEGLVRIAAVPDPIRCDLGFPVLMQIECEVGAAEAVGRTLATRPDARFVTMLTGSYDVLLEIVVPSRGHLGEVVLQDLTQIPGIRRTTSETVIRNFKTTYDWARPMLGQLAEQLAPPPRAPQPSTHPTPGVDVDDLHLIQLLASNGRLSAAELAKQSRLSESSVRRRLDALSARRAVHFATFIDPPLMGFHTPVFLWLDVDFGSLDSAVRDLMLRPEVRYLSATAGYSDLTAEVILPDLDSLYQFLTEVVGSLPGVRRSEIGIELGTLKRGYRS